MKYRVLIETYIEDDDNARPHRIINRAAMKFGVAISEEYPESRVESKMTVVWPDGDERFRVISEANGCAAVLSEPHTI